MTTLKPQLVRADTLDLQDHNAPSAKDHTRQPTHPSPYGQGPAAPHQTQALRNAEHEAHNELNKSPRVSEDRGQGFPEEPNFFDDPDDELENERMIHDGPNETNGEGQHYDDGEQIDDDLDDDLMDKISSSPSIDDGKYTLPIWPLRADSIDSGVTRSTPSTSTRGAPNSSLFTSTPEYSPLFACQDVEKPTSHQIGEYAIHYGTGQQDLSTGKSPPYTDPISQVHCSHRSTDLGNETKEDYANIEKYLLPVDDPLLDNSFDDYSDELYQNDESDWEDEEEISTYQDDSNTNDDTGSFNFTDDPRFIDSGWGGECLREIEDIDFEFVYALHTFVATVEGQANATKGDTMVLLDDSNSYWWLVRVVKDGSIGYLPAEHIETPTERLARLNKHRNIDLSATMLGDNPEKSKNPLKKAMRRRNAKTVQFAAPTYFEPSDYEYSDDEDDEDSQLHPSDTNAQAEDRDRDRDQSQEEQSVTLASTPLAVNTQQNGSSVNGIKRITSNESLNSDIQTSPVIIKPSDIQPAAVVQTEDSVSRSRKGNVRNTDSFFKDDSVETKKISLTPRLLRGDSEGTVPLDQDTRQRPSLDTFDKLLGPDDHHKDDKKKKEKKGMLSGLFRRKEKNVKGAKNDEEPEKVSEESVRFTASSKDSFDSLVKPEGSPERKPSKLQKLPPPATSPKASPIENRSVAKEATLASTETNLIPAPTGPAPVPPSLRPIQTEENQPYSTSTSQQKATTPMEKKSIFAPIATALKPSSSQSSLDHEAVVKPIYSKRAKNRFAIDDSDSEDDRIPTTVQPLSTSQVGQPREQLQSDSPTQFSSTNISEAQRATTYEKSAPLAVDTSRSVNAAAYDSQASPGSASNVRDDDAGTNTTKASPSTDAPTPSTSRSTPTWSDASLRSYMDNDQGIKDLLIIIHDNSNAAPAGADHPVVGGLFMNERNRLAEMQSSLDSLLTGWISKKNASLLSR